MERKSIEKITNLAFLEKKMNIITLTTDFGQRDYAVGALKGKLYSLLPDVCIVDISHQVEPFNIFQASYILKNAYGYFPKGTIHILGVENQLDENTDLLVVSYDNQFFVSADNGFVALLCQPQIPKEIYKVILQDKNSCFPTLDVSTWVAQKIAQGVPLSEFAEKTQEYLERNNLNPQVNSSRIVGNIVYIDHYGNVISNISKQLIQEHSNGRRFDIFFRYESFKNVSLEEIPSQYNHIEKMNKSHDMDGEKMILFNHQQYLELAIYRSNVNREGGASSLLGFEFRDVVSINFID